MRIGYLSCKSGSTYRTIRRKADEKSESILTEISHIDIFYLDLFLISFYHKFKCKGA